MSLGALHLVPGPIGQNFEFASYMKPILFGIEYFIVENEKTARRILGMHLDSAFPNTKHYAVLDEHTEDSAIPAILEPLLGGKDAALLSEAGLPCVADPGSRLVLAAQRRGIRVHPYPGPSSIYMALMASGLNGQRFMFDGYIPVQEADKTKRLRELEALSAKESMSVGCIETPYRAQKLFETMLAVLRPGTLLCVAEGIMTESERIVTKPVSAWRQAGHAIPKIPAVFYFSAR